MANAEVAEDAEHPHVEDHSRDSAPVDVAGVESASDEETPTTSAPDSANEPVITAGNIAPISTETSGATPALKWSSRILLAFAIPVAGLILLTPVLVAVAVVVTAAIADVLAALSVARLLLQGHVLQAEPAMNVIVTASRLGFLALGYLGLFTALIALADGLLGRGRGRLFIIPGIILTGSALVLFATSVVIAAPLLASLHVSHRLLAALALVFAVNAVAIATFLADTRDTRRRWLRTPSRPQPAEQRLPPD